jgi:hypothetical protein
MRLWGECKVPASSKKEGIEAMYGERYLAVKKAEALPQLNHRAKVSTHSNLDIEVNRPYLSLQNMSRTNMSNISNTSTSAMLKIKLSSVPNNPGSSWAFKRPCNCHFIY